MGVPNKNTIKIDPDAVREAIAKTNYSMTDVSKIIGMSDNYVSSLIRYGAGDASRVRSIAMLLGVPIESLMRREPEPVEEPPEPSKTPLPNVSGQTIRGLYDQLVKANTRLDDMERELRRLQAMEMRQDKIMNQLGALVELLTRWSDHVTKITNQATGCNTNLLRLLALLEGKKRQ